MDLCFQAVAGTEKANAGFGISLALPDEAWDATRSLRRGTVGDNVMYFETGQGGALSAGAHHGVDQQTVECRAYAEARRYRPLLVNTVVGFIGPEYLFNGKQIIRAGLEDHFCGKLLGLPMGADICYTNHADADQDDMDILLTMLGARMAVVLIGERPGLSSPHSLGVYMTYAPTPGCADEARNCISNVRSGGLSVAEGVRKLCYLVEAAFARRLSGVNLKDDMADAYLPFAERRALRA